MIPATISRYVIGIKQNFQKLNLLEACDTIKKSDVICLLVSYLDLSTASDNDDIHIKGNNLCRTGLPNNLLSVYGKVFEKIIFDSLFVC